MTDEPLFRLRDVRKSLGAFTLHIDELEACAGEVLALLGPTGAGKTTLLRLLAGLARADEGELVFAGDSLVRAEPDLSTRRRLAMVHQRPLLLAGSVRFNVEYGLRLRKRRGSSEKVDDVLRRLQLAKIARQSSATLSGGQTQLVALARALVIEPDVLLLDEPTAHLDPAHVALVEETIHEIRQQRRITIVWATHNVFQARRVADRATLVLNGRLIEAAAVETFFEKPADPRTNDFVEGRMVY
jgi:tungstate transport system ATP-binding protein